jgi:ureidoacrylate peracid hydrolase
MSQQQMHGERTPLNLNPRETALIVVDMQNGFIRDEGFMRKIGLDISRCQAIVPNLARLLNACRAAGVPVIFTRYVLRGDYKDAGLLLALFPGITQARGLVAGTWDAEIIDELAPSEGEWIVDKTRYSAFYNTNLEVILRGLNVKALIVTGVTTNICVESTIRDAFFRDYQVIVPTDATAAVMPEMEEGTFLTVKYGFGQLTSVDDIVHALGQAVRQRADVR